MWSAGVVTQPPSDQPGQRPALPAPLRARSGRLLLRSLAQQQALGSTPRARLQGTHSDSMSQVRAFHPPKCKSDQLDSSPAQLFERMLRCDRVYEKNKQRLRLREAGYAGLSLLFSELHITPTLIRCLLNQVLHTGQLFFYYLSVFYTVQLENTRTMVTVQSAVNSTINLPLN